MYGCGIRLKVLEVLRRLKLFLVRTTVQRDLLLQSQGRLPEMACIISNGMRSFILARRAMIHVQKTMAHK